MLRCSGLADVEPLVSGGTGFFFMLLKLFLYCHLPISFSSGFRWGLCFRQSIFLQLVGIVGACSLCSLSSSRVAGSRFQWLQMSFVGDV